MSKKINELSNSELLLKVEKAQFFMDMLNKEVRRRGLKKTFTDKLTSFFETRDIPVTTSRTTNIGESIRKVSPPSGRIEVVSDSDSSSSGSGIDPAVKIKVTRKPKTGGAKKSVKVAKLKAKKATKAVKPPAPPPAKPKKRAAAKATVKEIKLVLERNNVKFKSKDTKPTLLEIAAKHNLLRTIEYFHEKNSS